MLLIIKFIRQILYEHRSHIFFYLYLISVSDPYSSNPDPAKILNPDPVPDPDPSYFLPLSKFCFISS